MKAREAETARRFGVLDQCTALEKDLFKIDGVSSVDFDLSGFYDNMHELIFLTGYNIDVRRADYFEALHKMRAEIVETAQAHDLTGTDDRIEDYGAHLYFVRRCGKAWDVKES